MDISPSNVLALRASSRGVIALIPCSAPTVPLEEAPLSALVPPLRGDDRWSGYWGMDDGYYARCDSRSLGLTRWYRLGVAAEGTPMLQHVSRRVVAHAKAHAGPDARTAIVMVRGPGHPGRCWSVIRVRASR